jgi:hypothetical protein
MGFKKYLIASFLFLIVVALIANNINSDTYTLKHDLLGINLTLEVYAWVVLPALILFIATILHMIFYGTKGYLQRSAINKDISKISMILNDRLLDKQSSLSIKTESLKGIADILNTLELKIPKKTFEISPIIDSTVKTIKALNDGKYIPVKDLKLPEDNIWAIKNTKNRVSMDDNFAAEVVKNSNKFEQDLVEFAFDVLLENKPITTIKKIIDNVSLTNHMIEKLLLKDADQLSLTNHEILDYLKNNTFKNKELIAIARNYKLTMQPEQLLSLFEDISANNEYFTSSYLYLLFEYQMIDKAREILFNSQRDEFVVFKALLDLKDSGKYNYNIDDLILQ